jgi:hypothetical protein
MKLKRYAKPAVTSEKSFETSALACGKTAAPPAGSHHMASAYDTFTGHLGSGFGASESASPGIAGVGFGPGGTSSSYAFAGLCGNWVGLVS